MKILGTGLTGLVGSRIVELLNDQYEFENISRNTGIDITDKNSVSERIKSSDASVVLHLAAKTDVDECEKDRDKDQELLNRHSGLSRISQYVNGMDSGVAAAPQNDGEWNGKKTAWAVNVYGTQNIADACHESKKKIIYISTDFVFDGTNLPAGGYSEEDIPSPINWYARTKYEGEKIVQKSSTPWVIARISYPYRSSFEKLDFARAILNRLQNKEKVMGVADQIFTPTFIDDIVFAIDRLIKNDSRGIFHVVGNQSLTPYEAAIIIAKTYGFDQETITKTTRDQFFKDRAPRPFQLALKNDKIGKLGVRMRTFEEGLKELKAQMSKLKTIA